MIKRALKRSEGTVPIYGGAGIGMRRIGSVPGVRGVLAAVFLFLTAALMPAGESSAETIIDFHHIDTSVATGKAFGDIFDDLELVKAGTELSAELENTIETYQSQVIPFAPALSKKYGTLDNVTYGTSNLTRLGNVGHMIYDDLQARFSALIARIGGGGTGTLTEPQ